MPTLERNTDITIYTRNIQLGPSESTRTVIESKFFSYQGVRFKYKEVTSFEQHTAQSFEQINNLNLSLDPILTMDTVVEVTKTAAQLAKYVL
jgi:hypothetical protein